MAQRCFKQSCCGSEALQRSAPAPSCVTLPAWRQLNSKLTDASNTKYVQLMLPSPESFRVSSISNFGKDLTRSPAQVGPDKNCGIWPLFFCCVWMVDGLFPQTLSGPNSCLFRCCVHSLNGTRPKPRNRSNAQNSRCKARAVNSVSLHSTIMYDHVFIYPRMHRYTDIILKQGSTKNIKRL